MTSALALRLAARRCALEPQPSPRVRGGRRLRAAGSAAQKGHKRAFILPIHNGVLAVRDVVGTSHAIEASELQGLARAWTGVEAFAGRVESSLVGSVFGRWVRE